MYVKLNRWCSTLVNYIKTLGASFYSPRLYVDVVKCSTGMGIGYFCFVILLGVLPLSYRLNVTFNHFFEEKIVLPMTSIPLLPVHHGQVLYLKPMPYIVKNNLGEVVLILDTTGKISEMNQNYPDLMILINKNKITYRPPSYKQFIGLTNDASHNPIYTRDFDDKFEGYISGKDWLSASGILKLKSIMKVVIFPLVTLFYFIVVGVILLILASIAQLYADIFFNRKIGYQASVRLLSVAATPALLLYFSTKSFGLLLPAVDYIVIILAYLSFGLYSVKRLCT